MQEARVLSLALLTLGRMRMGLTEVEKGLEKEMEEIRKSKPASRFKNMRRLGKEVTTLVTEYRCRTDLPCRLT